MRALIALSWSRRWPYFLRTPAAREAGLAAHGPDWRNPGSGPNSSSSPARPSPFPPESIPERAGGGIGASSQPSVNSSASARSRPGQAHMRPRIQFAFSISSSPVWLTQCSHRGIRARSAGFPAHLFCPLFCRSEFITSECEFNSCIVLPLANVDEIFAPKDWTMVLPIPRLHGQASLEYQPS